MLVKVQSRTLTSHHVVGHVCIDIIIQLCVRFIYVRDSLI